MNSYTDEAPKPKFPAELVDELIKGGYKNSGLYVQTRKALFAWYAAIGVARYPISSLGGENMDIIFVDFKLDIDQLADCAEWWKAQGSEGLALLDKVMQDGYRVSFVADKKNTCVITSLIGKSPTSPNRNMCMTTRHATVLETIPIMLYKHLFIFEGGAWGEAPAESLFG